MIDFNNAISHIELIPGGTITKARLSLKGSGNHGDGNLLHKSEKTGSVGINVYFTITGGKYKDRKIYQLIGLEGVKKNADGDDIWGSMGHSFIRSILESAHNIHPIDKSEKAVKIRNLDSYNDLEGLECIIKIGVEEDKTGKYHDKNKVKSSLTPAHKDYSIYMSAIPTAYNNTHTDANSNLADDEIPF